MLIAATPHCIKMMISEPLKTTDQHFALYKIITLPERITPNRFVQYLIDYPYFGLHVNLHDCFLFTESHYKHFTINSNVICPAYTAIYSAQTLTCEFSLLMTIAYVRGNCFSISKHRFFNNMEHSEYASFQNTRLP